MSKPEFDVINLIIIMFVSYYFYFCSSLNLPLKFQSLSTEWSISLMSAYYPVVLTGASLIVCFWAEVFHLREVRWDRPRFLSKVRLSTNLRINTGCPILS